MEAFAGLSPGREQRGGDEGQGIELFLWGEMAPPPARRVCSSMTNQKPGPDFTQREDKPGETLEGNEGLLLDFAAT